MAFVTLCRTEEIEAGKVLCRRLAGAGQVAVARLDGGTYVAFEPRCPHANGPIAEGRLHGSVLVCPWHFFRFDLRTGKPPGTDSVLELKRYPVSERNGELLVNLG
jgi:nitrite reductase (NADH) small subunit